MHECMKMSFQYIDPVQLKWGYLQADLAFLDFLLWADVLRSEFCSYRIVCEMGKAERSQFAGGVQVCVGECRQDFMTKTSKYYYFVVSYSPENSRLGSMVDRWSTAALCSLLLTPTVCDGVITAGIYHTLARKHITLLFAPTRQTPLHPSTWPPLNSTSFVSDIP